MSRKRDHQVLSTQGAIDLLRSLEPHLPISLAELCGRLQAGMLPFQAGDELGRKLAANWQMIRDELNRNVEDWRLQAESYRMAWETCRKNQPNADMAATKSKIAIFENQVEELDEQLAMQMRRQRFLEQENLRLTALLDEQQDIIADQQLQLAQMDESSIDI